MRTLPINHSVFPTTSFIGTDQPIGTQNDLPVKLFSAGNDGFVCMNCEADVLPTLRDTPRNHCPFCLHSRHVDINPGDRANTCGGLLEPIGVITSGRKGYIIVFECVICGEQPRVRAALRSKVQPDDFDKIIDLSTRVTLNL